MLNWKVQHPDDWKGLFPELLRAAAGVRVWLFAGEMGAGKTTFIRHLGQYMGITENISSPTFGIVNEYRLPNDRPVFHFDFYRIHDPDEALDIGWEAYLEHPTAYCWVEWPRRIESLWPNRYLWLSLELINDIPTARSLTLKCP